MFCGNIGEISLKSFNFPLKIELFLFLSSSKSSHISKFFFIFLKFMMYTKSLLWKFLVLYIAFKKYALSQKTE